MTFSRFCHEYASGSATAPGAVHKSEAEPQGDWNRILHKMDSRAAAVAPGAMSASVRFRPIANILASD
jgi:hypothetical protein